MGAVVAVAEGPASFPWLDADSFEPPNDLTGVGPVSVARGWLLTTAVAATGVVVAADELALAETDSAGTTVDCAGFESSLPQPARAIAVAIATSTSTSALGLTLDCAEPVSWRARSPLQRWACGL